MKAVISYRYNGEIVKDLELLLLKVCDILKSVSVDSYCVFFEHYNESNLDKTPAEMMRMAFSHIDQADILFVIQTSEARSEGMLMEIGYAFAKGVRVIIATKKGIVDTYLPSMADYSLIYENVNDLAQQVKKIDFCAIGIKNNSSQMREINR